MDKLKAFEANDAGCLYAIAEGLWKKKSFEFYLTSQQLSVVDKIFSHKDPQTRKKLFRCFIDGKVSLRIVAGDEKGTEAAADETNKVGDSKNGETDKSKEVKDTDTSKAKEDKPESQDQQDQQDSDVNLNEQSIANGVESARAIALKIRYILYEKAVDYYYDQNDIEELDEYNLLGDDNPDSANSISKPELNESSFLSASSKKERVVDEDENYDDEDGDGNEEQAADATNDNDDANSNDNDNNNDNIETDEEGNLILEVPISPDNDANQVDTKLLIDNFNKIYHSFEGDKETLIKRKKLEENDKLLLEEQQDELGTKDILAMNLGAANLSLKHLLHSIEQNKESLNLQDNELRQLIMDVRKNRSKWASDDKIGQEELYEACEKVVMELRGYTEHSTAFLNKVSKREAPNYLQVIKKPMDLNTILKKLKSFQYNSKAEFVDDVMLIWKNCLFFNSDPKHFLRAHAIAMQKKSLKLIPLIPDITIRDRSEVENLENEEVSTPVATNGKSSSSKKGKKRTRNGEIKLEENNASEDKASTPTPEIAKESTPGVVGTGASAATPPVGNESNTATPLVASETAATATPAAVATSDTTMNEGGEGELDEDDNGDQSEYLNQQDDDKDDFEIQSWKNITSKSRADYCMKRSELFKDNKLNMESEAILRNGKIMSIFQKYLNDYSKDKKSLPSFLNDNDDLYLTEYDVSGGIPPVVYQGIDDSILDKKENELINKILNDPNSTEIPPSDFVKNNKGLNKIVNENIEEMQEIRRICFKISLIRQMQQQQFIHHSQIKPPDLEAINDDIDIDPISRFYTHDKLNKELNFSILQKKVSKLAMNSGFESTETRAINTLTQLASDHLDGLIKTVKVHLESQSINHEKSSRNIILLSLLENGITKPDELYTYITENVIKQNSKLKDLKSKLSNFLKILLQPALEINEKTFNDNSEQFISGGFSAELGDDFFGFKELGLDKELGALGQSIPLHLLHSRYHEANNDTDTNKVEREAFETLPYTRLKESDIPSQIKLFEPVLVEALERTKAFIAKQLKNKKDTAMELVAEGVIMDDDDYPKKNNANKTRLPPTGKIAVVKKKITPQTFFLPEEEEKQEVKKEEAVVDGGAAPGDGGLVAETDNINANSLSFDSLAASGLNDDDFMKLEDNDTELFGRDPGSLALL